MTSPKSQLEALPAWAKATHATVTEGLLKDILKTSPDGAGVKMLSGEFVRDESGDMNLVVLDDVKTGCWFTVSDGLVTVTYKITSICCSMCTCSRTGSYTAVDR